MYYAYEYEAQKFNGRYHMKFAIIYYSQTGHTREMGEVIATVLQQHMFAYSLKVFCMAAYKLFLFLKFVIFY